MRDVPGGDQSEHSAPGPRGAPTPDAYRRLSPRETGGDFWSGPIAVLRDGDTEQVATVLAPAPSVPSRRAKGQVSPAKPGLGAPRGRPSPSPARESGGPNLRALGLYLHLPFCDHKCAYCDFNSYAGLDHLIPAYTDALVREIGLWRAAAAGYEVVTVFFGGGTPSLTPLPQLERILAAVRDAVCVAPDAEITLEANPGTVDEPSLRGLHELGVNRLSLGVQSFDDDELRRLDRIHNAAQAV